MNISPKDFKCYCSKQAGNNKSSSADLQKELGHSSTTVFTSGSNMMSERREVCFV